MSRKSFEIDVVVNSKGAEKDLGGINNALVGIGKAALGLVALDKLKDIAVYTVKTADEFTALTGRLEDTMEGFGNLGRAMENIKRISRETGTGIQTVGKMFETMAESAKSAGKTEEQATKLVETLARLKTAYNIDTTGFSSAMLQFNQALSAGVLRGEEFNGVIEGASPVMRAMAQALGVNVGHMRKLAEAGVLTTDKMFMLTTQLDVVTDKMNRAPKTIATEWGKLVSEFDQSIISLNETYKITEKIAETMGLVAKGIHKLRVGDVNAPTKVARSREAVGEDLDKKHKWIGEGSREKAIDAVMKKEKGDETSSRSSGLESAKKQMALDEAAKAEEAAQKIARAAAAKKEQENYEKLAAGAPIKEKKPKSAEQLAEDEQRKNDELNAQAEKFELLKIEQFKKRDEDKLKKIEENKQAELEINGRYSGLLQEVQYLKEHSIDKMDATQKKLHMSRLKNFGLQTLNEAGNNSKKMFEIAKAANLADAIVTGYAVVQSALKVPPAPNFGMAALAAAQTAVQVRGIMAQKFGGGGGGSFTPSTGGGSSGQGFGAISEKFSGNQEDIKPKKQINITIADGDMFSSKSIRELIKAINEEVGSNVNIQAA